MNEDDIHDLALDLATMRGALFVSRRDNLDSDTKWYESKLRARVALSRPLPGREVDYGAAAREYVRRRWHDDKALVNGENMDDARAIVDAALVGRGRADGGGE